MIEKVRFFIEEAIKNKDDRFVYELICQRMADWGLRKLQEKKQKRETETTTIEKVLEDMNLNIFAEGMDTELVEQVLSLIALGMKSIFLSGEKLKKYDFFLQKKIEVDWWYYDKGTWGNE